MEENTKLDIILIILAAILIAWGTIAYTSAKSIEKIKITSDLMISTTIDTIYEQCIEEENITITTQKTLKGKTAKLERRGETCVLEIKQEMETGY